MSFAMELFGDVSFLEALETTADFPSFDTPGVEAEATETLVNGTHRGPRPYRSRKNRPCDFCRTRKAACKIAVAPPCVLCRSYGKDCTFNNQSKRKRSVAQPNDAEGGSPPPQRQRIEPDEHVDATRHSTSPQSLGSSQALSPSQHAHEQRHSPKSEPNSSTIQNGTGTHPHNQPPTSRLTSSRSGGQSTGTSFTLNPSKSAVWVGDTGEADPWLCRRYQYEQGNNCVLSRITYQRIQPTPDAPRRDSVNESYEEPPLIFMLPDDALADRGEPRVEDFVIQEARKEVLELVPDDVGERMIKLFFRFVYPYFPVLSMEHTLNGDTRTLITSLPLSLLTAIYATALPFMLYDEYLSTAVVHSAPSAVRLYRICWTAINQEMHTPRLATLQACLLILQRPPTNRYIMDTPWRWSMVGWTVSLASILGLCKSCSGWSSLPVWERRLRGRLWWATYVMDKWSLLGAGMPSHVDDDNFDVPDPTLDDRPGIDHEDGRFSLGKSTDSQDLLSVPTHFYHLVRLTVILSDIVKGFYSIRATSQTANNFTLSLERARPLRNRLKDWREESNAAIASTRSSQHTRNDSHSPEAVAQPTFKDLEDYNADTLDGNASLRLAYIIAVMTLYRALLRALENTSDDGLEDEAGALHAAGRAAVLAGAKECAKEAVEFAEDLRKSGSVGVWDAFWHSWSRSNFALCTSFLMRVLINVNASPSTTREDDMSDVKTLIARWRRVLRLMSGNAGNGMTSLALLRLEGDLLQEPALLSLG